MKTTLLPRISLERLMQHHAPLLFPFPFATGKASRVHVTTPAARYLVRTSQSQGTKAADDQLRKIARSRRFVGSNPETSWTSRLLPTSHSGQTAAPRLELTSVRALVFTSLYWTKRDWPSNVLACGGNTNCVNRSRSVSSSPRVGSGQTIRDRSANGDWNVSYGTSAMKINHKTSERRYSCAASASATRFTKADTEKKKDTWSHESVPAEKGDAQAICELSLSEAEEDSRTVSVEKEGKSSLSVKGLAPDPDVAFSSQCTKVATNPVTSSEFLPCEGAKPGRFIRVNRPGSARNSDISQACSSGVTTCSSLRQEQEQEGTSVEHGEGAGKPSESKLAEKRDRAKEENVHSAENMKQGAFFSSGRRQIQGQEEFGFKYKGPEPTTHGEWAHKGRVTDF